MGKYEFALIGLYILLVIIVTFAGTNTKKMRKREIVRRRRRIFLFSLFLTPIAGIVIYLRSKEKNFDVGDSRYIVSRYKCDNCGYKFDEHYDCCPICEKEGLKIELEEVKQIMT